MSIIFKNKSEYSGTLSNLSWAYQNVMNISAASSNPFFVEGYIDLKNMAASDSINIQENIWINSSFAIFKEKNYSDAQDDTGLRFHSKIAPKGIYHLKLNQSYGTKRNYDYHFVILNTTAL